MTTQQLLLPIPSLGKIYYQNSHVYALVDSILFGDDIGTLYIAENCVKFISSPRNKYFIISYQEIYVVIPLSENQDIEVEGADPSRCLYIQFHGYIFEEDTETTNYNDTDKTTTEIIFILDNSDFRDLTYSAVQECKKLHVPSDSVLSSDWTDVEGEEEEMSLAEMKSEDFFLEEKEMGLAETKNMEYLKEEKMGFAETKNVVYFEALKPDNMNSLISTKSKFKLAKGPNSQFAKGPYSQNAKGPNPMFLVLNHTPICGPNKNNIRGPNPKFCKGPQNIARGSNYYYSNPEF